MDYEIMIEFPPNKGKKEILKQVWTEAKMRAAKTRLCNSVMLFLLFCQLWTQASYGRMQIVEGCKL